MLLGAIYSIIARRPRDEKERGGGNIILSRLHMYYCDYMYIIHVHPPPNNYPTAV